MNQMKEIFNEINCEQTFISARNYIKMIGIDECLIYMKENGYVNKEGQLTTDIKPFNAFARIISGVMPQDRPEMMKKENSTLEEKFKDKYIIASNLEHRDLNWDSKDFEKIKEASMSKNHRFLLINDISWEWFNILIFGLNDNLGEAITILKEMKEVSEKYARNHNWSNNLGLFFHVYPLNSVQSLHLHMVDMDNLGTSYYNSIYKNLSLYIVLKVLEKELSS